MDDKKIKLQRLNIDLPKKTIERMKECSKYYLGCKRKKKGSAALFARKAIEDLIKYENNFDESVPVTESPNNFRKMLRDRVELADVLKSIPHTCVDIPKATNTYHKLIL